MSKAITMMKKVYWKGRKQIKKLPPVKAAKKYLGRKRKDKLLYETLRHTMRIKTNRWMRGKLSLLNCGFRR
mgnify:CR=1 FL=1